MDEMGTLVIAIIVVISQDKNGRREKLVPVFRQRCTRKHADKHLSEFSKMNPSFKLAKVSWQADEQYLDTNFVVS